MYSIIPSQAVVPGAPAAAAAAGDAAAAAGGDLSGDLRADGSSNIFSSTSGDSESGRQVDDRQTDK